MASETTAVAPTAEETAVGWLTAREYAAWRAYVDGSARVTEALARQLEQHSDLTLSEYEVLVRLSESEDWTLRMSEIADELAHSRSRVTHAVRRMEARGLVRRVACAKDGRGVNCVMTQQGFDELSRSAPGHVRAVRKVLVDVLSPDELDQLGAMMTRISEAARAAVAGCSDET